MRSVLIISLLFFTGCQNEKSQIPKALIDSTPVDTSTNVNSVKAESKEVYANPRFRNVTISKVDSTTYEVMGEGQIFEASFSWIVEDGHNELLSGHVMTSAGAPDWGKFNFTVTGLQAPSNATLHLVLFEASAKDGSRQYELPILLK